MSCFMGLESETGIAEAQLVAKLAEKGVDFQQNFRLCARTTNGQPPDLTTFLLHYVISLGRTRKRIPKNFIVELLRLAKSLFEKLPNVIKISRLSSNPDDASVAKYAGNVTVIGDIHGQFDDLYKMLYDPALVGFPSETNQLIFNGDLVDRGDTSVEVIVSVLLLKVLYPDTVHILRGNHESLRMNEVYGFAEEVCVKYDVATLKLFTELFNTLPICAIIQEEVFVVHGGLGPQTYGMDIAQINAINRFVDPTERTPLWELLWQDPVENISGFSSSRLNSTGGFGADSTESFLARNQLQCLVRAHQEEPQGHCVHHHGKCITVFSAPNYMHDGANTGAVIRYSDPQNMVPEIVQFTAEHYKTHKVLRLLRKWRNGSLYQYYV